MPARASSKILTAPGANGRWPARFYWLSTFLLAAAYLSTLGATALRFDSRWPEAGLLLLATLGTLAALARQLPAQNVFLAALIIAVIGSLANVLSAKSGLPFGQFMYSPEAGWRIFGLLPWMMPLLWVTVVLNSRGVVRLILRPWRKTRTYGLWLIGLTALLALLFDSALEPFAVQSRHYWIWAPGGYSLTPQGAPIVNSLGWFSVTLLMLAFVTPILINKQLSKRSAPDLHPLAIWLGSILLFAAAAAMNGFWPAVAVDSAIAVATMVFAIRGARW